MKRSIPRLGEELNVALRNTGWRRLCDFVEDGTSGARTFAVWANQGRIIAVEYFGEAGIDGIELFYPSGEQSIAGLTAETAQYACSTVPVVIPAALH